MDVAVRNGLPSVLSNVDANIKSSNCSVALLDQEPLRLHKLVTRINFSLAQIKIVRCVPLRDNQPMSFGDWKSIQIHVGEFVLLNNPDLNWFNQERDPTGAEPECFDQSPTWQPKEVSLGDGRTLVLDDS